MSEADLTHTQDFIHVGKFTDQDEKCMIAFEQQFQASFHASHDAVFIANHLSWREKGRLEEQKIHLLLSRINVTQGGSSASVYENVSLSRTLADVVVKGQEWHESMGIFLKQFDSWLKNNAAKNIQLGTQYSINSQQILTDMQKWLSQSDIPMNHIQTILTWASIPNPSDYKFRDLSTGMRASEDWLFDGLLLLQSVDLLVHYITKGFNQQQLDLTQTFRETPDVMAKNIRHGISILEKIVQIHHRLRRVQVEGGIQEMARNKRIVVDAASTATSLAKQLGGLSTAARSEADKALFECSKYANLYTKLKEQSIKRSPTFSNSLRAYHTEGVRIWRCANSVRQCEKDAQKIFSDLKQLSKNAEEATYYVLHGGHVLREA